MDKLTAWLNGGHGRVTGLAAHLNITHSAVCQWTRVPSERVLAVEEFTGISRHVLRPDIYGVAEAAA